MREAAAVLLAVVFALVLGGYLLWAVGDARRRGKSALLVLIAVVLFFPLGLVVWLLVRPPVRPWTNSALPVSRR
jgi:hypothetical protein